MSLGFDTETMVQVLRDDGSCEHDDLPDLTEEQFRELYEWMHFARAFDQRSVSMQRQGRMGTYPPATGQEACQIGSAFALRRDDWIFPTYRENAALMVHGVPPERILLYWMGREEGSKFPEDVQAFPISIPIATQIPHAAGAAWAAKLQGHQRAFMAYLGDGGTSEGDFHEAANFAGVFQLPLVIFCQNNGYAISVPVHRQTASATIAQKAVAYGFPGIRVDGNDILAVYKVTRQALDRAREGKGPTLIEAVTYRWGPHTTVDDPSRYRSEEEVEPWRGRDPIARFRRFLEAGGLWSEEDEKQLQERVKARVADAVRKAEAFPEPNPEDIFDFHYAELPDHLREQKEALLRELIERGEVREHAPADPGSSGE